MCCTFVLYMVMCVGACVAGCARARPVLLASLGLNFCIFCSALLRPCVRTLFCCGRMTICWSNVALVGLLYASACAGAMPDINVQYEFATEGLASASVGSTFAKRASALAKSIRQADTRMSEFSNVVGQALRLRDSKRAPSSFLSSQLQPVDGSRVRKSLAATEPMVSPAEAAVHVIETEDIGAMLERAKYQGMLDEIARLHPDFEHGVAELAGNA